MHEHISYIFLCFKLNSVVSGDICQQFTREMFDMYQGFASHKNWAFEVFNYTPAEYGRSFSIFTVTNQLQT